MEYVIGLALSLAVLGFAVVVGFDRERCFYPVVLIVVATYYVLFAVVGGSGRALAAEMAVAGVFIGIAVLGFKGAPWIAAAGIGGHGVLDYFHHLFIGNAGLPPYWPGFCMTFDVVVGLVLAARMLRSRAGA
ncbi:MAG: hypothetical protein J0H49_18655 [Acidobacteria bacterium]|nr:hypothetical protein [Acidobacteriota bacterium]